MTNSYLSSSNRLGEYVKITDGDGFLAEYVDYLQFYGAGDQERLILFCRNNGQSLDVGNFHITRFPTSKAFILKIQYYYQGHIMEIGQLKTMRIKQQNVLMRDIYGKGILVLNREKLRHDLEELFMWFSMGRVILTRIDYAVDCKKINFNKKHKLKTEKKQEISDKFGLEYIRYGSKKSPQYLRFYNKRIDLVKTNYERLYPEYNDYDGIMRYELQINSDGIAPQHKIMSVLDLRYIANFGMEIEKNRRPHSNITIDRDFKHIKDKIFQYKKEGAYDKLGILLNLVHGTLL